jgi:hypothetical protein
MTDTSSAQLRQFTVIFQDYRILLILFFGLRLSLLLVHQPLILNDVERGVMAGGDFQTYFNLASLPGLPLRDWWSEFPPVWPYLSTLIAQLQPTYTGFALLMGLLFIMVDAGNLHLIRLIGTHLHGPVIGMGLAWVYMVLAAPLIMLFWSFEVVVTCFLLLGLWLLLSKRESLSAIAVAVGILTKFTPVILLGAVIRYRSRNQIVRYGVIVFAIVVAVFAFFMIQNSAMTLPSLTSQFNKASYQSVWALLDGNYRTGNFGPLADRLDPALAGVILGNPPVVPGWLRFIIAAAIGLFVFLRTRRLDSIGQVAFVTITLLIFFLQAQGWSPQWLLQIIPLLLLCFPNRLGFYIIVLLSLLTFVEYPLLFLRTGDTGGEIVGAARIQFAAVVLLRTTILVGCCVALYQNLRKPRDAQGTIP